MSNNHHYLPQFYLNGFVGEDEKLHYCRKQFDTYKDIYPAADIFGKSAEADNSGLSAAHSSEGNVRQIQI